jgi:23S rRNA pseudouridine2457 synthase
MLKSFLYIIFNKPFGVICQFSAHDTRQTLANFGFPKNVYPVGRLDAESEGLLILTDDGFFQHHLIEPRFEHSRTYHVQVENIPDETALNKLRSGVELDGKRTRPAAVRWLEQSPPYPERIPPIRVRKNIPTSWLEITLTEGRNRQIRKMTASVGLPTLRLVRTNILVLNMDGLEAGQWRYLTDQEVRQIKSNFKS